VTEVPIDPSMPSTRDLRGKRETPAERALRIAWLREEVASGDYFVPAELLARSILRRVGSAGLDLGLQHQ
jgi:hypothetical protein